MSSNSSYIKSIASVLLYPIGLIPRAIGRTFLYILGWKFTPAKKGITKAVAIMAPHTSTWDIVIGMAYMMSSEVKINWVGKKSLFTSPLGFFFTLLGGIPLDRENAKDTVGQVVQIFDNSDRFVYGISPEATRDYRPCWRSGFYHIAKRADVPMLLFFMDFKTKHVGCGPMVEATGDIKNDILKIKAFYDTVSAKNPEKMAPVRLKEDIPS